MALRALRMLTVEDYRLLPETGPRYQLIDGELYMAPAPNRFHQDISWNLVILFGNYLKKHPVGKMYHAPFDVVLGENDVFQPDICFFSNASLKYLTAAGAEGPPDLVVEILSPSTATLDCGAKARIYAREDVGELWIVDPNTREVRVFLLRQNAEQPAVIHSYGKSFKSALFPGLTFKTSEIFEQ